MKTVNTPVHSSAHYESVLPTQRVFDGTQTEIVESTPSSIELAPVDSSLRSRSDSLGEDNFTSEEEKSRALQQIELDLRYAAALESRGWRDALEDRHRLSKVRKVARFAVNALGFQTSTQKDIQYHKKRIDAYETATRGPLSDLESHVALRDAKIDADFISRLRKYLVAQYNSGDDDVHTFLNGEHPDNMGDAKLLQLYGEYMSTTGSLLPSQVAQEKHASARVEEAEARVARENEDFQRKLQGMWDMHTAEEAILDHQHAQKLNDLFAQHSSLPPEGIEEVREIRRAIKDNDPNLIAMVNNFLERLKSTNEFGSSSFPKEKNKKSDAGN